MTELLEDYEFEPDDPPDINRDQAGRTYLRTMVAAFTALGYSARWLGDGATLLESHRAIKESNDFIFNLAGGKGSRNRASAVPLILEMIDMPFSGSDAFGHALSLNKYHVHLLAKEIGLPTPETMFISGPEELQDCEIRYPVIIKPCHEGSSVGISEEAVVSSRETLAHGVSHLARQYRQPVLVQEFIPGQEVTVPLVGNESRRFCKPMLVELDGTTQMGNRVFSSGLKAAGGDRVAHVPWRPGSSSDLEDLCDSCWRLFRAMGLSDYARMDFRLNSTGKPFLLEVNAMADLSPESSFARAFRATGRSHTQMLALILEESFARW